LVSVFAGSINFAASASGSYAAVQINRAAIGRRRRKVGTPALKLRPKPADSSIASIWAPAPDAQSEGRQVLQIRKHPPEGH